MLKSLLIGMGNVVLGASISLISGSKSLGFNVSGVISLILFAIAAVMSGALVSGDRTRANFSSEFEKERKQKMNWSWNLTIIALPGIVSTLIYYSYFNGY